MKYENIISIIKENSDIAKFGVFGDGTSDDWIEKAQDRLHVKFPFSYIWWLKNYNGGEINGDEIFSIYEMDFDTVVGGDIVYINEQNRKNGISSINQLVIQENDHGEIYYFDLRITEKNSENPIFVNETKYASNFLDFLKKKIFE